MSFKFYNLEIHTFFKIQVSSYHEESEGLTEPDGLPLPFYWLSLAHEHYVCSHMQPAGLHGQ